MLTKKILIIDDEPDVNTYLEAVLKSNGYETYSISDVENAMDRVKEIHPKLICLDIMMPRETGISFYSKLRKDKDLSTTPVIIISGVVESEKFNIHSFISDKSIPAPECYMEKPINVEKFIKTVKQLTN
jgi:DNA-binding response OmpR family regulator